MIRRYLTALVLPLIVVLLFGAGVWAGRMVFPRREVIQVDRRIVEAVPVPGETKIVTLTVPGPVQRVGVPVEVIRYVDRPGKERIITVTKEVEVPVEVVRKEWPQTITVRVGAMLDTEGVWRTPAHPDLVIGQVSSGVYAVPKQDGWRIDTVTTETRVQPPPPDRWTVQVRPLVGAAFFGGTPSLVIGGIAEASRGHQVISLAAGQSTTGPWGLLVWSYKF